MTRRLCPHPGKTPAQRRALDAIGCGEPRPSMTRQTRDALLRAGLIVEVGTRVIGRDRFGAITIREYSMPLIIHMQWCGHHAEEFDRLPPEEQARLMEFGE